MTDNQGDTVADIFCHVALGELLASVKPAEYWESHAEAPYAEEAGGTGAAGKPLAVFVGAMRKIDALGFTTYGRVLSKGRAGQAGVRAPGAAALALDLLKESARRLLFCDLEAEHLQAIRMVAGNSTKVECIQEDGVSILRGAAMLLPEPWPASTFAFLNPADCRAVTDAGITCVQLWCELASRGIVAVMGYRFGSPEEQAAVAGAIRQAAEKARLTGRGGQWVEGTMAKSGAAGAWGFGVLMANVPAAAADRAVAAVRGLERAFSGDINAWTCVRGVV